MVSWCEHVGDVDVLVTAEKGARLAMTGGVLTTEDPFTSSGATFSVLGLSVDLIKTRSTGRFKALEVDGVVVRVATLKWLLDEYKEVVADGLGDKVEAAKAKEHREQQAFSEAQRAARQQFEQTVAKRLVDSPTTQLSRHSVGALRSLERKFTGL